MADEEEFAGLTDRIATAVTQTQGTLQSVANELSDEHIGRMLGRRMEEVQMLRPGVDSVRALEQGIDNAEGAAVEPAKQALVSTFRSYQVEAGNLSSRIGAAQRDLDGLRESLHQRGGALKNALRDLERIEQLPDRATDDVAKLRGGVEYLNTVVDVVDQRVEQMMGELSQARSSANSLENSAARIDGTRSHSAEIGSATREIGGAISQAQGQVGNLRTELDKNSAGFRRIGQFAVDVANQASAEKQQADVEKAQLADAARAGFTPQPAVDPRIAYSMGAQEYRPDTDGQSKDRGQGR
ncbi:hypothetical protein EV649_0913 [Kribbella sp. VKM Ac-2569]|uniref:hypothetical protein n=1 Tax=Kribbella sp. VKM Ac-2569 TaxID=2512220 RepID=UPI00102B19BB|nr:hypothetical protein [Kribbella sp. VKM Ac-2569]RZT27159.1 hypothetical protein EV649_0913 [Kribbella sp. VKM Ac-2569]